MKTLLKNARILSMKDNEKIYVASIIIIDDSIAYIGDDFIKFGPFDKIIDINGNVIMPGFKNAHGHAPMSFARALTDGEKLHDWLNNTIFPIEENLNSEDSYLFAKISFLEYLTSGITSSSEMYYFPDQIAKAAIEMGYKVHLVLGGVKNFIDAEQLITKLNKLDSNLVTFNLGLHAIYSYDNDFYLENVKVFHKYHSPLFIHASETKKELDDSLKEYNMSPIQFFDSVGYFDFGGTIYHCNYLLDDDYEIIKRRKLHPVTCPGSNSKLASGICPVRKILDSNIPLAIGTDGPASNDSLDMFYEMKLVLDYQKILYQDASIIKPLEVLKMATVNGALAMGLNDCLYVEVGQKADLIEIDLADPSMQPINDIETNIVLSGSKRIIKMTMVNGKILYRNNEFSLNESLNDIYNKVKNERDRLVSFIKK